MYHTKWKGFFKPKNPAKYKGNSKNIVYRSFLEFKMMVRLDADSGVEWWSSEETVVPYKSPVDGEFHRYFVDFVVHPRNGQTTMIEVKPANQTKEPAKGQKKTRKYLEEIATWGVNSAKWAAAESYCNERGWKFKIVTERDLGVTY